MKHDRVLGIFAKWPAPGAVKTRLGKPAWSAKVARAFILDTLNRLKETATRRVLAFDPLDAELNFAEFTSAGYELSPQGEGDLGQRLKRFFTNQIILEAQSIVVLGTDSPTLPGSWVNQAFAELERADVVLGPATDGGYYLIGSGRRLPPIFEAISWGKATVLAETMDRLNDPSWRLALLPPWYDIDTPADWELLRGHVAAMRRSGADPGIPHTEALLSHSADYSPQTSSSTSSAT
jgi:rSAM/selenodomain-associated transferase 1